MYSPKYVDYLDEKRIESAFYNHKSKPQTRVGIIPKGQKALKMLDFWVTELPRDNKMTTF